MATPMLSQPSRSRFLTSLVVDLLLELSESLKRRVPSPYMRQSHVANRTRLNILVFGNAVPDQTGGDQRKGGGRVTHYGMSCIHALPIRSDDDGASSTLVASSNPVECIANRGARKRVVLRVPPNSTSR